MTEIERIKEVLEYVKNTGNFTRLLNLINESESELESKGISNWLIKTALSLITTIESQNEKLTRHTNLFLSIEASMIKFLSLLNITIESHPSVELQAEAFNQLIESQKEEIEKWKKEALAVHPTQWAYDQACKALNNKTAALESLQKENEQLRSLLSELCPLIGSELSEDTVSVTQKEIDFSLSHIQEG